MDIKDLTMRQIEEIKTGFAGSHPYKVGKNYLIRTSTMAQVGELAEVHQNELLLKNASWVADTGRFNKALSNGLESQNESEIELFGSEVVIGRSSIIDACIYNHPLPTENK
jgi:hypothetical protein